MAQFLRPNSLILVLLIATFSIGYSMAQNRAVVIPLGGDEIPGGAIMAFNRASCPGGWSHATATIGRTIVGLSAGGTLGGTSPQAAAFTDRESRTHNHRWALYFGSSANWNTFADNGNNRTLIDWSNGIGAEGSGIYPIGENQSVANDIYYTSRTSGIVPYVQYIYCEKN